MTDRRDPRAKTASGADDIEQLRSRIKELEAQLQSRPTPGPDPRFDHAGGDERMKKVATVLGATTVVMAAPAFITVRRWLRWWRW